MNLTTDFLALYGYAITRHKELISVKKDDYYYFILTSDKEKVIIAVTPDEIFLEDKVTQEHLEKARKILEDPDSIVFKRQFDGEVFTNECISHDGEIIYTEKTNGEIIEYIIPIDGKEYRVVADVEKLLNGETESALEFDSNYTEEEKNKILSKLMEYHTSYKLIRSEISK